ncbi:MAG: DHA2 family efflux MFS transporter permease subunit [Rhizobiales bacterium]|nr:DHA2 family efflux MFS transporter permease subunit [Hyphomicrobiales bacterium]
MENLDSTIISTSLPAIALDLKEDPISLKLALTSYLLSLAIFIPASGWAADRFGSRTVFRLAIAGFTVGSILCGLSSSLPQFVGARFVQGIGGAMMVPVGRLVVFRSVPRRDLVRALAFLTTPALIGPVLGPPVGGFITTYFHWRWIFWINVPIGVVGILLATRFIEDFREDKPERFDLTGFLLVGAGLASLIFGLTILGRGFLPRAGVIALILSGATMLILYGVHARRSPAPIVDLSLMRIPTFRASVTGGFVFRIGVGAIPFLLPLMLQLGFGLTPFQSGLLTFASSAGALLMKPTASPILSRFGFKPVLVVNAVLSASMLAACGLFRPDTPHWAILGTLLVGGFLRSLEFTSINAIAYADMPDGRMSKATSFTSTMQQLSLTTGVAVGAGIVELTRRAHHETALSAQDFSPAFFIVGAISTLAALVFMTLPKDAGASLRGVRRRGDANEEAAE